MYSIPPQENKEEEVPPKPEIMNFDEIPVKVSSSRIYHEAADEHLYKNEKSGEVTSPKTSINVLSTVEGNGSKTDHKDMKIRKKRRKRKKKVIKTYSHVGSRLMDWRTPVTKKNVVTEGDNITKKVELKKGKSKRSRRKSENKIKKTTVNKSEISPKRKKIPMRRYSLQTNSITRRVSPKQPSSPPTENSTKIKKRKTPDRYKNIQSRLMDWRKHPNVSNSGEKEKPETETSNIKNENRKDKVSTMKKSVSKTKRRHSVSSTRKSNMSNSKRKQGSPKNNKPEQVNEPKTTKSSSSVKKRIKKRSRSHNFVKPNIYGSKRAFKNINRRRRVLFNTKRNDLVEVKRMEEINIPKYTGEGFIIQESEKNTNTENVKFLLPFDDSNLGVFHHDNNNNNDIFSEENFPRKKSLEMTSIKSTLFLKFSKSELLTSFSSSLIQLWKIVCCGRELTYSLKKEFSVHESREVGIMTSMCKIDDQYFAASFGLLGTVFVFDIHSESDFCSDGDKKNFILPFRRLRKQHQTIINSMLYLKKKKQKKRQVLQKQKNSNGEDIIYSNQHIFDPPFLIVAGGINKENPTNCPSNISFFELILSFKKEFLEDSDDGTTTTEEKRQEKRIEELMENPELCAFGKLEGGKGSVNCLKLLDNKKRFISCSDTGMVCVWEMIGFDRGELMHVIRSKGAFTNVLSLLVFSKDYIILGMSNCELHIWELSDLDDSSSSSSGLRSDNNNSNSNSCVYKSKNSGRYCDSKLIRKLKQPNNKPIKCLEWMYLDKNEKEDDDDDDEKEDGDSGKREKSSFVHNHMFVSGSYQCLAIWSFTEDNVVLKDQNERVLFVEDFCEEYSDFKICLYDKTVLIFKSFVL